MFSRLDRNEATARAVGDRSKRGYDQRMKVLERLPVMSDAELLSLAENARANLAKPSASRGARAPSCCQG